MAKRTYSDDCNLLFAATRRLATKANVLGRVSVRELKTVFEVIVDIDGATRQDGDLETGLRVSTLIEAGAVTPAEIQVVARKGGKLLLGPLPLAAAQLMADLVSDNDALRRADDIRCWLDQQASQLAGLLV